MLLHHKTTYRPWYDKAMEKIKNGLIFDEIFFNEKGELTEGARSNIILQLNGELFTPPVECGLLNGVLRQKLLKQNKIRAGKVGKYAHTEKIDGHTCPSYKFKNDVHKKILYLSDLQKAEKIFCINSVRGIVEVKVDCLAPAPPEGAGDFRNEQKPVNSKKSGWGAKIDFN
jgi:para-aminobenzoate synthetase/4-amino-4-deoxychorismate lyase